MRLQVADADEAQSLVEVIMQLGPAIADRQDRTVLLLWPAIDADDPDEWDEQTFSELIFFLRAWSGHDEKRQLSLLEERPIELPEQIFRRAS